MEDLGIKYGCKIIECEEGYFSPNIKTEPNNPLFIRSFIKKIGI